MWSSSSSSTRHRHASHDSRLNNNDSTTPSRDASHLLTRPTSRTSGHIMTQSRDVTTPIHDVNSRPSSRGASKTSHHAVTPSCDVMNSSRDASRPSSRAASRASGEVTDLESYHVAAMNGDIATLRRGTVKKCEGVRREDGMTPMMIAAQSGHLEALRLLVEKGCRLDRCDLSGNTALHQAASGGHVMCSVFLAHAPQGRHLLWMLNNNMSTAADLALLGNHTKLARLLNSSAAERAESNPRETRREIKAAKREAEKRVRKLRAGSDGPFRTPRSGVSLDGGFKKGRSYRSSWWRRRVSSIQGETHDLRRKRQSRRGWGTDDVQSTASTNVSRDRKTSRDSSNFAGVPYVAYSLSSHLRGRSLDEQIALLSSKCSPPAPTENLGQLLSTTLTTSTMTSQAGSAYDIGADIYRNDAATDSWQGSSSGFYLTRNPTESFDGHSLPPTAAATNVTTSSSFVTTGSTPSSSAPPGTASVGSSLSSVVGVAKKLKRRSRVENNNMGLDAGSSKRIGVGGYLQNIFQRKSRRNSNPLLTVEETAPSEPLTQFFFYRGDETFSRGGKPTETSSNYSDQLHRTTNADDLGRTDEAISTKSARNDYSAAKTVSRFQANNLDAFQQTSERSNPRRFAEVQSSEMVKSNTAFDVIRGENFRGETQKAQYDYRNPLSGYYNNNNDVGFENLANSRIQDLDTNQKRSFHSNTKGLAIGQDTNLLQNNSSLLNSEFEHPTSRSTTLGAMMDTYPGLNGRSEYHLLLERQRANTSGANLDATAALVEPRMYSGLAGRSDYLRQLDQRANTSGADLEATTASVESGVGSSGSSLAAGSNRSSDRGGGWFGATERNRDDFKPSSTAEGFRHNNATIEKNLVGNRNKNWSGGLMANGDGSRSSNWGGGTGGWLENGKFRKEFVHASFDNEIEEKYASIESFLKHIGLSEYIDIFTRERIDMNSVKLLTDSDFKDLGLQLGPRRVLITELAKMHLELYNDPGPLFDAVL